MKTKGWQNKAGEVGWSYVVAKGKEKRGFLPGKLLAAVEFGNTLGTHGKSTKKAYDDHVDAGRIYLHQRSDPGTCKEGQTVCQIQTYHDSGKDHKGEQGRNHILKPKLKSLKG